MFKGFKITSVEWDEDNQWYFGVGRRAKDSVTFISKDFDNLKEEFVKSVLVFEEKEEE